MRCANCGYAWQQSVIHSVEVREQQVTIPAATPVAPAAVEAPPPPPPPPPMPEPEPEPEPEPLPEPEPMPEPEPEPEPEDEPLSQDDLDNLFGEAEDVAPIESMVNSNIDGDQSETIEIEDLEDGEEGEPIPEALTAPLLRDDDDEIPVGRPRFQQPQPETKGRGLMIFLILLGVTLLGVVGFAFLAKDTVFSLYPPAKQMYIDFGLYEPAPGEGLAIPQNEIKPTRDLRGGVEFLFVEGKVINITDKPVAVPPLRVSLTNNDGKVVASEVLELNKAELEPGETLSYKAEFESPPGTARSMTVDFVDPDEMENGDQN